MSYYRGDYYRGDYYRGDPFLGAIGAVVGGLARKVLPKAIRGIGRAARGLFGKPTVPAGVALAPYIVPPSRGLLPPSGGLGPGFGPELPPPGQALVPMGARAMCQIKGTRPNKSTYITRGGGTSRWPQQLIVHEKGTECVKSRRLNVANPRALRRAIRRAQGFAKLARRVMSFSRTYRTKKRKK